MDSQWVNVLLATCTVLMLNSVDFVSTRTLYISNENCSDTIECLSQERDGVTPCCSLEYISRNVETDCSNLTIIIDSLDLNLKGLVKFDSCYNMSILGKKRASLRLSVISCEDHREVSTDVYLKQYKEFNISNNSWMDILSRSTIKSHTYHKQTQTTVKEDQHVVSDSQVDTKNSLGFHFSDVHGLLVTNVKITGCGLDASQTIQSKYKSSFLLTGCSNVNISYVHFEANKATAIFFQNVDGYVNLDHVSFVRNQQNRSQRENKSYPGGLLAHFNMSQNSPEAKPVHFLITNCIFDTNHAPRYREFAPNLTPVLEDWMPYGLGGAVGLIFMNDVHEIKVEIKDSYFHNNTGVWGAGLCIQFQQRAYNNVVNVTSSVFSNNCATMAGGGANVRFEKVQSTENLNSVTFADSIFQNNTGRYGGGVLVFASAGDIRLSSGSVVNFENCSWVHNFGRYSPAVDISPFRFDEQSSGFLPIPSFKNCIFAHNRIVSAKHNHTLYINSGVFVITHFEVQFSGSIKFVNNSFTALYITWGRATFTKGSHVQFINNTGIRGGAVVMYGFSTFGVHDDSIFMFTGNYAHAVGGGIYYVSTEQREYFEGRRCFLDYIGKTENVARRNLTFVFKKNMAEESGASIYSASFYACFYRYYGKLHGRNLTDFFKKIGEFHFDNENDSNMTLFGTYGMKFFPNSETLFAMPGKLLDLDISLLDEFNETLPTNYVIKVDGDSIKLNSVYTSNDSTKVFGPPGKNATLILSTQHPIRSVYCQLNLSMVSCSPGFYFNEQSNSCSSSSDNSVSTKLLSYYKM